jgi:dienelactone hydrolase
LTRALLAALFVLALVAGVARAGASVPPYAQLVHLYDYDASHPLDLREEAAPDVHDAYTIHDISFASPVRGRVPAFLVLPDASPGRVPAVLFSPGSGGHRDDQLTEAAELARHGVAALLIEPPHVRPGNPSWVTCTVRDRATMVQYVLEERRAVDVLLSRPEIDGGRIAHVGFSLGSSVGAVLSGVDHRIRAFAIMSGAAHHTYYLRQFCKGRLKKARLRSYIAAVTAVDPIRYVSHASPSALLFQNGRRDATAIPAESKALQRAASTPKTVLWYRSGHLLPFRAVTDRNRWLAEQLGFSY